MQKIKEKADIIIPLHDPGLAAVREIP